MAAPLVKINSDSAKEIAGLYGIGSDLAERVVAYREANGYLHTREELSKVEGVSKSLAVTLAPPMWIGQNHEKSKKVRGRFFRFCRGYSY
jgi:competence ComEA-like helix-hairpin-helix protein